MEDGKETMPGYVRRVVCGHDAHGKAIVVSDGAAPLVHINPRNNMDTSTDIWRTGDMPATIVTNAADMTNRRWGRAVNYRPATARWCASTVSRPNPRRSAT